METKRFELTPELKAILKDQVGFTVDSEFKYVPRVYRENNVPKEFWPVYTLKSKDGVELCRLEDNTGYVTYDKNDGDKSKLHLQSGTVRLETLRTGIRSVKNQMMEDGGVIVSWDCKTEDLITQDADGNEKTRNKIKVDKIISMLKAGLQVDLQNAINERKTLTDEELAGLEF